MGQTLPRQSPPTQDNFTRFRAYFRPPAPSGDLRDWLWRITPPSARTVPILETPDRDHGPGHVPYVGYRAAKLNVLYAERASLHPIDRARRIAKVLPSLPKAPGADAPDKATHLRQVRDAMPKGKHFVPGGSPERPRAGYPRWQMEMARESDLLGRSHAEIAEAHHYYHGLYGNADEGSDQGRRRSVERHLPLGRGLLSDLGAWPWSLAENGELPDRWWERDEFADALHDWHFKASVKAISDTLVAVECLTEDRKWRWIDDAAIDLYYERLEALPASRINRPTTPTAQTPRRVESDLRRAAPGG